MGEIEREPLHGAGIHFQERLARRPSAKRESLRRNPQVSAQQAAKYAMRHDVLIPIFWKDEAIGAGGFIR